MFNLGTRRAAGRGFQTRPATLAFCPNL